MKTSERFSQIFVALLAALTPIWATYAAYQQFQEQVPKKAMSITTQVFHLSENFSALGPRAFSLNVGDRSFDNIVLVLAVVKNTGQSPIVDSEIKRPLSVSVGKGWEIVAVEGDQTALAEGKPGIKWERKSVDAFEAGANFLLNPTESIGANIYLSKTDSALSTTPEPKLTWNMRVLNMPNGPNLPTYTAPTYSTPTFLDRTMIFLSVKRMIILVVIASLTLLAYIQLLTVAGYANLQSRSGVAHLIASAVVSFAFAAAITHAVAHIVWPDAYFYPGADSANLGAVVVAAAYAFFLYRRRRIARLLAKDERA